MLTLSFMIDMLRITNDIHSAIKAYWLLPIPCQTSPLPMWAVSEQFLQYTASVFGMFPDRSWITWGSIGKCLGMFYVTWARLWDSFDMGVDFVFEEMGLLF